MPGLAMADTPKVGYREHIRLFGFPVHFRPSLVIIGALLMWWLGPIGVIAVVALVVSVLVHELCHAFAFRHYGTESSIVIQLFGGFAAPDNAGSLTDRQWVVIAAAGPLGAFALLGLPAAAVGFVVDLEPTPQLAATTLFYYNVVFGLLNLIPVWPFDGGRIFYHLANMITGRDQWKLTQIVSVVFAGIGALLAYKFGLIIGVLFLGFAAYRVLQTPSPATGRTQIRSERMSEAIRQAKSYEAKKTDLRGDGAVTARRGIYQSLVLERPHLATEPIHALVSSKPHRRDGLIAQAWADLLAGTHPATLGEVTHPPALLMAYSRSTVGGMPDVDELVAALCAESVEDNSVAAIVLMHRSGHVEEVAQRLRGDALGFTKLSKLHRLTLDFGLVRPQQILNGIIYEETHPN